MNNNAHSDTGQTPVIFSGEAGEYFRIWIVNIALTIVTLGIYSAWAKVRQTRYFYTHTSIASGTFDFHANPVSILIGRAIALTMVALYFGSNYIHPVAPLLVILLIFALIPWLVVRSRIFRMRNSSYRGIRFNFKKNYGEAFKAYFGGAVVSAISLGLATPTAIHWRNSFAVTNSGFGKTDFEFAGQSGEFYSIFFRAIGLSILGFILYFFIVIIAAMSAPAGPGTMPADRSDLAVELIPLLMSLPIFLFYLGIGVYMQVRIRNYVWNTTTLGENAFVSTLSVWRMLFLYLSNILAIVFSLGLLVPWAQIRLARYRAEQTQVLLAGDWESYVATDEAEGSALGDEIGEAFDVDVDLGF